MGAANVAHGFPLKRGADFASKKASEYQKKQTIRVFSGYTLSFTLACGFFDFYFSAPCKDNPYVFLLDQYYRKADKI